MLPDASQSPIAARHSPIAPLTNARTLAAAPQSLGGVVIDATRTTRVHLENLVLRSRGVKRDARNASAVAVAAGAGASLLRMERCQVRGVTGKGEYFFFFSRRGERTEHLHFLFSQDEEEDEEEEEEQE